MEPTRNAVILAAGVGKRLGLKDLPKCLVEIGGRTLMKRRLENLAAAGISRVVVVLGHSGEKIRERFGDHQGDPEIQYVENPDYRPGRSGPCPRIRPRPCPARHPARSEDLWGRPLPRTDELA